MRPSFRSAVELRLREKRGRLPQDLIRAFQLAILALEIFQTLPLVRGEPGALARVTFGLAPSRRNVSVVHPSLGAIAAHCDPC
jgi:hypothetical protein